MPRPDITKHSAEGVARRQQLRDQRRKRAKKMRNSGLEWAAIRRRLGVSSSTIRADRKAIEAGEVD